MDTFFVSAFALAPTAEKHLTDIQRHISENYSCPSALALPPVWPLVWGHSAREALYSLRGKNPPAFTFAGYRARGGVLFAAPAFTGMEAARGAAGDFFLPPFSGFYLADTEKDSPPINLPPLPSYTVKTLRLLVMEIHRGLDSKGLTAPEKKWWEAVSWRVVYEDWLKLEKPKQNF